MYTLHLKKPDGRSLTLYGRKPLRNIAAAPSPFPEPLKGEPHLRWHPLRGEWITYAAYRQGRTFLPPPEYNPLAVTVDAASPTELPQGEWDVAVFDNRFPSLAMNAHDAPCTIVPTAPGQGKCEVVVFTQDARTSLGSLPLDHIDLVFQVWAERSREIAALPGIRYVLPFENRGAEVGVTLHHPHGQIYAYPFVPPVPERMNAVESEHYRAHGCGALEGLIRREIEANERIVYHGPHAIAFVPVCARYPYEVWIAPVQRVAAFTDLDDAVRMDLARALKTVLQKYDGLWQRPFPYLMAWFQAPLDGAAHPESHLHAELYPPYRAPGKLKYLAGTELAAGLFAMDALPEEKARELQNVEVSIDAPEQQATGTPPAIEG
ncbi:MAG TPA: galactose-1-phosphate uridylyltransferase [Burkholderiales bacterium]|nr:galactose-1-phosphate uridylyltransferase [Burkholderiales bacterium]